MQTPTTSQLEYTQFGSDNIDKGRWVSKGVRKYLNYKARPYKRYYYSRGREAGFRAHWLGETARFEDVFKAEHLESMYRRYMKYTRDHVQVDDFWQDTDWGIRIVRKAAKRVLKEHWKAGYLVGEYMWFVKAVPYLDQRYDKRAIPKAYYEWLKSI